jgi:hypothetical protein
MTRFHDHRGFALDIRAIEASGVPGAHGPSQLEATLEGHGRAPTPDLRIKDQRPRPLITQNILRAMADPIDSAL